VCKDAKESLLNNFKVDFDFKSTFTRGHDSKIADYTQEKGAEKIKKVVWVLNLLLLEVNFQV